MRTLLRLRLILGDEHHAPLLHVPPPDAVDVGLYLAAPTARVLRPRVPHLDGALVALVVAGEAGPRSEVGRAPLALHRPVGALPLELADVRRVAPDAVLVVVVGLARQPDRRARLERL